jgi:hypothetical protein
MPIYFNISTGLWTKAKADSADTLATHVVVKVTDANTFSAGQVGTFTLTGHGLGLGYWFTSDGLAGALTQNGTLYSNPVLFVTDANTVILLDYRPTATDASSITLAKVAALALALG